MGRYVEVQVLSLLVNSGRQPAAHNCYGEIHEVDGRAWFFTCPFQAMPFLHVFCEAFPESSILLWVRVMQPDAKHIINEALVEKEVPL
jgi:hypothetical protein